MPQAKKKNIKEVDTSLFSPRVKELGAEIVVVFSVFLSVYALLSLVTYSSNDPGWSHSGGSVDNIRNLGGQFGANFSDMLLQLYVGNQVVDEVSFDLDTTLDVHAGVRQDVGEVGRVDFSISGTSIATDVWEDPYVVDSPRGNTERTSTGKKV